MIQAARDPGPLGHDVDRGDLHRHLRRFRYEQAAVRSSAHPASAPGSKSKHENPECGAWSRPRASGSYGNVFEVRSCQERCGRASSDHHSLSRSRSRAPPGARRLSSRSNRRGQMTRWIGIVLALPGSPADEMASRLVTYLHPVAGRPLVWHTAWALAALADPPERLVVLSAGDLSQDLFHDIPVEVEVMVARDLDLPWPEALFALSDVERVLVANGVALPSQPDLETLVTSLPQSWLPDERQGAAATWIESTRLVELLHLPDPLTQANGMLPRDLRVPCASGSPSLVVFNRMGLAEATRRVRDRLIRSLMDAGVTFLLPDSVLVDVDVRIGRDSVIYPGVVLEGQTTIGEETVVGPGCRIMDSWVGSGVELRGWNYISHTSIRNRAILEPYVRRGFD